MREPAEVHTGEMDAAEDFEISPPVTFIPQEELKLEKNVSKIETCWRQQTIEITTYKNNGSRFVLKSNDELRMLLDDHLLQLQSMLGSRFAFAVLDKIKKWERSLSVIREVLEAWLQVNSLAASLKTNIPDFVTLFLFSIHMPCSS